MTREFAVAPTPGGQWIRKPKADTAVVFVHGILSSGDGCWRKDDVYWPELLGGEESLSTVGIYVFSYRSDVFSAGYSLGDAVEALNAYLGLDQLLQLKKLIFVCHSMGGILVRQFLFTRQAVLIEKGMRIGLFLIASPSLGSDYANWLSALANILGNSQADVLRFMDNNTWLNDLDRNFINLKESRRLAIEGQELVEDQFIILPALIRKQVVRAFSGARYFGESLKIPFSDHFSIAKPSGSDALQHRLLVQFLGRFISEIIPPKESGSNTETAKDGHSGSPASQEANAILPRAPLWTVPAEMRFWECTTSHTLLNVEDIRAFLAEAEAAQNSGVDPAFKVEFPWIAEATDYIADSMKKDLSATQRIKIADSRKFIEEQRSALASLKRCISLLLDFELLKSWGWMLLDSEATSKVLTALGNKSFMCGTHTFDVFTDDEQVRLRVYLSTDECRDLPHIGPLPSEIEVHEALRMYAVGGRALSSMPNWFLTNKAFPAILQHYIFHKGTDPKAAGPELKIGKWLAGLG